uniref:SDR family NAD(P)-dependent oxidoreductase n=1 Tax=Streptomyces hawaiiensis TaxID=67305 RepID=UPI003CD06AEE
MKRPGRSSDVGDGRAIAEGLARRGASVVLHGGGSGRGDAVVRAIEGDGGAARFVVVGLADSDQVQQLATDAGDVDILVCSAGLYEFVPTARTGAASVDPADRRHHVGPVSAGSGLGARSGAAAGPRPFWRRRRGPSVTAGSPEDACDDAPGPLVQVRSTTPAPSRDPTGVRREPPAC